VPAARGNQRPKGNRRLRRVFGRAGNEARQQKEIKLKHLDWETNGKNSAGAKNQTGHRPRPSTDIRKNSDLEMTKIECKTGSSIENKWDSYNHGGHHPRLLIWLKTKSYSWHTSNLENMK
jgi:hypothetical protein